jgi:hypothetical protein
MSEPVVREYEFHPLAGLLPLMEDYDRNALGESIAKVGLQNPIIVYEDKILDGRNRYLACREIGYAFKDRDFQPLPAGVDPKAYVYSQNIHRRQLTSDQKKAIVVRMIEDSPDLSDRAIGKLASVDHKTVGKYRGEIGKRLVTFSEAWDALSPVQRQEFMAAKGLRLAEEFPRPK